VNETTMKPNRYSKSQALLARALKTIPLGSQTFSKSFLGYPQGYAPHFLTHGDGALVWDIDGNQYIDYVNGLLPIILGYNDPHVTSAVQKQLVKGVSFSLGTEAEIILSEKLVELIPCAESVRFGKNGSDATSGAIRIARAYTGRDHVIACGYHGWQDWYIGSTARNKGVPNAVRDLTHTFQYNDLSSLDSELRKNEGNVACVILEPMTSVLPNPGFLESVKELAHQHGALLIFDEIITGFRFDISGAQNIFRVTPDLATFGKSMGNGFPISAIVGRAEIMRQMEEIFFSFTAGGEALSIVAALATIEKLVSHSVPEKLAQTGENLRSSVNKLITKHKLTDIVSLNGHPSWLLIQLKETNGINSWQLKTLFMQEMLARGILVQGGHNISFSHSSDLIEQTVIAYDEVLPILADCVFNDALSKYLLAPTMDPIFKVRT